MPTMATIAEAFATALEHHQAGQLPAAEQLYRQILEIEPRHADALHLLGFIYQQTGRPDVAGEYIKQAILLNGQQAAYHHNLGDTYRARGQFADAVACYQQALTLNPDLCEALNNLGLSWQQLGRLHEAADCFRRAATLRPDDPEVQGNLGNVYLDQGNTAEAVRCYRRALEVAPNDAWVHGKLAIALKREGKLDLAIVSYQRALQINPELHETHYNLGIAYQHLGQLDAAAACFQRALRINPRFAPAFCTLGVVHKENGKLDEAIACYRQALELQPGFAAVYSNLGSALKDQGKLDEAAQCYRQALQLQPDFADAYNNLGNTLVDKGELTQAIDSLRKALQLKPEMAVAHNNLGNALVKKGQPAEAARSYQNALDLDPSNLTYLIHLVHQRQHLCDWKGLSEQARQVIDIVSAGQDFDRGVGVPPFSFLVLPIPTTAGEQQTCARAESMKLAHLGTQLPGHRRREGKAKITLGYLSADFQQHATAYLIAELFEQHDRARFEVVGYSYGADDGSAMRRRLVGAFDRFVDIQSDSHLQAAQRIAADEVDILIDLKGYAGHTRTPILAYRPSPIQVNYLGYPGTMGASFMDYILVDDFIVPGDQQPFFTEHLVHLPGCYQINDRQREIAAQAPTRSDCGLPDKGFVFCDFNNSYKITPALFDVWMEILREVPGSVLWLLEGNAAVPGNLRREAAARGVEAGRLVFAPKCNLPEHLARHRLADLFLDTYPVCAHTTTSDALWAGCPVLTLAGNTFVARVAGSLLRAMGLPELVTYTFEEYKAMALKLARTPRCWLICAPGWSEIALSRACSMPCNARETWRRRTRTCGRSTKAARRPVPSP